MSVEGNTFWAEWTSRPLRATGGRELGGTYEVKNNMFCLCSAVFAVCL